MLLRTLRQLDNLKYLDVSGNFGHIDDQSIVELVPLRNRLKGLNVGGNENIQNLTKSQIDVKKSKRSFVT